jgi:hypothetical protein
MADRNFSPELASNQASSPLTSLGTFEEEQENTFINDTDNDTLNAAQVCSPARTNFLNFWIC